MNGPLTPSPVTWHFWTIGVLALVWNAAGAMNFFAQTDPDVLAQMSWQARTLVELQPGWARMGFALAVFGGTAGCVLLLWRKPLAYYLFVASLAGLLIQVLYTLSVAAEAELGAFESFMYLVLPLIIGVFLVAYAKRCERRGWVH